MASAFFDIAEPRDLLRKMEHDYERLERNPLDTYATFDFFVTAQATRDWLRKAGPRAFPWMRENPPDDRDSGIWSLVRSLSNGGKHYRCHEEPHFRVREVRPGTPPRSAMAFWPGGFLPEGRPMLVVHLTDEEAALLGQKEKEITVLQLATDVLDLWRRSFERASP